MEDDTVTWRSAPAVKAALAQATLLWPERDRSSDGTVGDVVHSSRTSDHNPDERGVVLAFDLTHDPANGCDAHALVRAAVERRDPRIRYAISNRRIWSHARRTEGWRVYTGRNPHTKHAHISVERRHENDVSPWWFNYEPSSVVPKATESIPAPQGGVMFITNAKGDVKQWLIQNNGGTWITTKELSEELQAKGVPWVRDADPEWVKGVIVGGVSAQ